MSRYLQDILHGDLIDIISGYCNERCHLCRKAEIPLPKHSTWSAKKCSKERGWWSPCSTPCLRENRRNCCNLWVCRDCRTKRHDEPEFKVPCTKCTDCRTTKSCPEVLRSTAQCTTCQKYDAADFCRNCQCYCQQCRSSSQLEYLKETEQSELKVSFDVTTGKYGTNFYYVHCSSCKKSFKTVLTTLECTAQDQQRCSECCKAECLDLGQGDDSFHSTFLVF